MTEHTLHLLRNTLELRGNVPRVYAVLHRDGLGNGAVTCASLARGMDGGSANRYLVAVPTGKNVELYFGPEVHPPFF